MRRVANNSGICAIGNDEPHAYNLERIRKRGPKGSPHFGPMHQAVPHVRRMVSGATTLHQGAERAEIINDDDCRKDHPQNNNGEQTQQQNTVAVVPPNL